MTTDDWLTLDHVMRDVKRVEGRHMNSWPGGTRHAISQSAHEQWNARQYPGTRQLCSECDAPTGRCEDDTLSHEESGPLCEDCWRVVVEEEGTP